MNHRMLFILSIVVIVVGIGGIYLQNKHQPAPATVALSSTNSEDDTEQKILVAEALRDLRPYDILTSEDYKLYALKASSSLKDYRDVSSMLNGKIQGSLLVNNVAKGAYIIPSAMVASNDPDFIYSSLRSGDIPYSISIYPVDDYIISATHAGDNISLFIRLIEVDRMKKSRVDLVPEGSTSANKDTPKYSIMRLFSNITVLESKRYEKSRKEDDKNKFSRDKEEPIGSITLRMNQQQVAELLTVAKAGELFLLPEGGSQPVVSKIRMDDVLPQFRSVKELRGGQ